MAKRLLVTILTGLLVTCNVAFAASALNLDDGMWEVTSQVKMQGMTMPPMTFSQCITKADAVPQGNASGQDNCKVSDIKTVGNTVSWTITCNGQAGEMKGKGKITYQGDRFEGRISMDMAGRVMVTEMKGRRTGPCQ
ncbi:lipoprotein [Desulfosarcina alkanivorans]|uniref:Lipoprotein n=1 Tax=Desulfosarcina alkanivorans TaxID=571177 RepID=A0A5K7YHH3_9BACT|nr:DUF3617 family protein [Desulfosarcina alkanivorans]BBO67520.1 lipoprotein [Desulfosarcina alkanivorans]